MRLEAGPGTSTEFPGGLPAAKLPVANLPAANPSPTGNTRRDFLSLMGFTVAAAGLTGSPLEDIACLRSGIGTISHEILRYRGLLRELKKTLP
jgi:hypothetical protein